MTASADKATPPPPHPFAPLAAFMSYLVPGLGQIIQGRVGKGVLFMVCLYTLFFYGLFLGRAEATVHGKKYELTSNVYLPSAADRGQQMGQTSNPLNLPNWAVDIYHRPQFLGQFWMGIVVWPAVWQYTTFDPREKEHATLGKFMRTPTVEELNAVHTTSDKSIDLGWVCTVIAGVLNILVIYDALAGPAFPPTPAPSPESGPRPLG